MKLEAAQRLKASEDKPWFMQGDFHGRVVALPSKSYAKCHGPGASGNKMCAVCDEEQRMLAAGTHPGAARTVKSGALIHPDYLPRGRTSSWFQSKAPEQKAEYREKFPGTKFVDKTKLVTPE